MPAFYMRAKPVITPLGTPRLPSGQAYNHSFNSVLPILDDLLALTFPTFAFIIKITYICMHNPITIHRTKQLYNNMKQRFTSLLLKVMRSVAATHPCSSVGGVKFTGSPVI